MSTLRRLRVPLVVAGLTVLAGISLGRVYNGQLVVGLVAGAALGSVLVSVALRRAAAWLVAPTSVLALAAYTMLAINISAHAAGVSGDLATLAVDAARNAVPRLLTALIPVEAQPDTVLAPVVLAWLAGFAGAELAVRAARPAVALVPPTLLYAGALVLVGPNADIALWQPVAFAGLAALGLTSGATGTGDLADVLSSEKRALRLRTAAGFGIGLVAVLALVALLAPVVAGMVTRPPTDPRRYVQPPALDVLDLNPLIRISGWAANPEQHLFDVTVLRGVQRPTSDPSPTPPAGDQPVFVPPEPSESSEPGEAGEAGAAGQPGDPVSAYDTRLRLAVLADWDGVTWHVNADYRNAGRVLPAGYRTPASVDDGSETAPPVTIQERITVAELQGRLLPAVSAPHRVDGVRVAYDAATGTLLHPERLTPGVTYTVTSVSPSVDVNLLPAADVPSGAEVARYLAVGDAVPADLSRLAEQIAIGEGSPYLRALALETFLAEHYRFASEAPSGHAYPNLRFFLFGDPRAGGRQGTSEQFAASYAALGRLLGLPTRVVVGFRTPAGGGAVSGGDALAWPEVLFDGVGWVAFDPMPVPDTPPRPLEDEFLPKPNPSTSPPASVEPEEEAPWSAPPSTRSAAAAPGAPGVGAAVIAGGVSGGLLILLVLFLLVVVLLRAAHRHRRLDQGSPPQRVLGAWDEVLDALTLAGATPATHLTAADVSDHAATIAGAAPGRRHTRRPRPPAPPLSELATLVNAVSFGATVGGTAAVDDAAADEARSRATMYAAALRARRSWWRRQLWRVDPRPLRRR